MIRSRIIKVYGLLYQSQSKNLCIEIIIALGIACNFFLYVFVNIAMVMGAIPVGGVPLPLISHGGSAMITVMIGFGLLMSVHVHRDAEFSEATRGV